MSYKLPKIVKCCCCIPLEYGVIVSAYVKITIDLIFLVFVLMMIVPLIHKTIHYIGMDMNDNSLFRMTFLTGILVIDVIMNVIFIVSSKLKKYKLVRIYYYYMIYMLAFSIIYFVMNTFSKFYFVGHYIFNSRKWREMFQELFFEISALGLQYYYILMVRSRLLKMKSKSKKRCLSEKECNTPEPGTSSGNNDTKSDEQIELKEILAKPTESFNYKEF